MTDKVSDNSDPLNLFKWFLGLLVMSATVYGSYFFAEHYLLYRVIGVSMGAVVALAVLATTTQGRGIVDMLKGARVEMRKVVWPTTQETKQMTGVVLVITAVMAFFLWLIDLLVGVVVSSIIG